MSGSKYPLNCFRLNQNSKTAPDYVQDQSLRRHQHHIGTRLRQEMLDFCGEHSITADVEIIPIQKINEAYERMVKSDVKYRFSIDMASLKLE